MQWKKLSLTSFVLENQQKLSVSTLRYGVHLHFFSVCVYYIVVRLLSGYILSMLLPLSSFWAEPLTWFISKVHLWTFVCEMSRCLFLSCVSLVKITKCEVVQMHKTKRKRGIKLLTTLPPYHCVVDICNVFNYFNIKINFL